MVGRQLPFFSLIVPFWLVAVMAGLARDDRGVARVLVRGRELCAHPVPGEQYHGPWLVDIAGAIVSMLSLLVLLRFWQPRTIWRFDHESDGRRRPHRDPHPSPRDAASALDAVAPALRVRLRLGHAPGEDAAERPLARRRCRCRSSTRPWSASRPSSPKAEPEPASLHLELALRHRHRAAPAGIVAGSAARPDARTLLRAYGRTLLRVRISLLTIAAMLALGFTTRYSGADTTMGLAFASTGVLFPFFSPLLGWLGVALTGSDTSSNVLFGNLQKVTATQLGVSPDPHRRREHLRRRDGQDDRRAKHRGRERGDGPRRTRDVRGGTSCAMSSSTAWPSPAWWACSYCSRPTCSPG